MRQNHRGIMPYPVSALITRGSGLEAIRHNLAIQLGRPPKRSEVVAAWNERKAQRT
ncbi:hypothetical protein GCM10009720_18020 [Yaniella flava]|uniref:Uncharacterized protein n=1 Tax=Yaniella flava TaxID=287930 RepID=A0ABP5G2X0_9MICC